MDQYTMMDILGKAFADGEIDALRPLMAADCDYASQYANKSFSGASESCQIWSPSIRTLMKPVLILTRS